MTYRARIVGAVLLLAAFLWLGLLPTRRSVREGFGFWGDDLDGCLASTEKGARKLAEVRGKLEAVLPGSTRDLVMCESDRSYTLNKRGIRLRLRRQ